MKDSISASFSFGNKELVLVLHVLVFGVLYWFVWTKIGTELPAHLMTFPDFIKTMVFFELIYLCGFYSGKVWDK